MRFTKARWVFLVYLSCTVAFLAASVTQREEKGVAMLFLTLFFESVCFPTIVALGIRGLGRHYKRGSGFIVGGVCGGAVVPPILGHVADMRNDTGFAMIVPTMVSFKLDLDSSWPRVGGGVRGWRLFANGSFYSSWLLRGRMLLRSISRRRIGIRLIRWVRVRLGCRMGGLMRRRWLRLSIMMRRRWLFIGISCRHHDIIEF